MAAALFYWDDIPGRRLRPTSLVRPQDEPTAALLIAAAVEVMSVHGYHGSSVRDIAILPASGVVQAAIYWSVVAEAVGQKLTADERR